jgi:hypothetical protein
MKKERTVRHLYEHWLVVHSQMVSFPDILGSFTQATGAHLCFIAMIVSLVSVLIVSPSFLLW